MSENRIYRVDKFKVPPAALPEFLEGVRWIHQSLRALPGFVEEVILEQMGNASGFNIATIVVWENTEAAAAARAAMSAKYQETGFKPAELIERLGIEADMAGYQPV